jgi:HlyD family secretion protein
MQIDSSFAEADIGNIRPNQEVNFTIDAAPDRIFKGFVKQIRLNPTTQQNVVTYDVVILVDNPDGVLLPGMTAYVNIKTSEHKDVMLVPNAALRYRPQNDKIVIGGKIPKAVTGSGIVYKVVENKLEPITCKLGVTDSRDTEITTDKLIVGDSVAVGDVINNGQNNSTSNIRMRLF